MSSSADEGALRIARFLLPVGAISIACRQLGDPDLPWHLAVGREFFRTHSFVSHDVFSYSRAGTPSWHHHLAESIFWSTHLLAGPLGLQVLGGVVAFAILLTLFADAGETKSSAAIACVGAGWISAAPWYAVRPTLLSLLLFSLLLLALQRVAENPERRWLFALPLLQLAWAHTHGVAVLGAVFCAGFAVYNVLCRLLDDRFPKLFPAQHGTNTKRVVSVCLLAVAATCASPHGLRVFSGPSDVSMMERYVSEWVRTTPAYLFSTAPLWLLLALGVLAQLFRRERQASMHNAFTIGVLLLTLVMGLQRTRLLPLFALASGPWLARAFFARATLPRWITPAAVIVGVFAPVYLLLFSNAPPGVGFYPNRLPIEATRVLQRIEPTGRGYHPVHFGGWLTYQMHPRVRVLIDGRIPDVFPLSFVEDLQRASLSPTHFASLQSRWGFTWAMIHYERCPECDAGLSDNPAWLLVHIDAITALYVLASSDDARRAPAPFRALRHNSTARSLRATASREALQADLQRLRSNQPTSAWIAVIEQALAPAASQTPASP